jgi:hypothetical protein
MAKMTAEEFKARYGTHPVNDDLARVNCELAGQLFHQCCGLCEHGTPRFHVCYECHPELKAKAS